MVRFFLYAILILGTALPQAFAEGPLRVRTGETSDYSRLVLDWQAREAYTVSKPAAGQVVVTFKKPGSLDQDYAALALRNFSNVRVLSENPLTLSIDIPADSRTRDFYAGDRLLLDVYNSPSGVKKKQEAKPAAAPKAEPKAEAKKEEAKELAKPAAEKKPEAQAVKTETPAPAPKEAAPPAVKEEPKAEAKPEAKPETKPETAPAPETTVSSTTTTTTTTTTTDVPPAITLPEPSEKQLAKPAEQPVAEKPAEPDVPAPGSDIITFSATKTMAMAVFEMNGDLWMVNDESGTHVRPQVEGPRAKSFKSIETQQIEGGGAFTVAKPLDRYVQGQGGGLIWQVILSPVKGKAAPVQPVRKNTDRTAVRAGSVVWPFKEPAKLITVRDPVSGADIKVVSVKAPADFAGPGAKFVDFDVLPSALGLAIMPKVDDLEVKITPAGVEVSRSGGLALARDYDVLAAAAPPKAPTAEKAAEEAKDTGKKIFDFEDWRMGDLDALRQNTNLILANLKAQSEPAQVEGLLRLAKMYLAHAHGSEAMGFLDMAEAQLPDIAANDEFLALRGAARALSWDSEEAFYDLSNDSLNMFPEIGYWRAYALADLGDWVQAHATLPPSLSTLKTYPELLFNRLAPVIAEVLLRAGEVKQAEPLLVMLEANKADLFPQQSAALGYLQGEAARQEKKIDEAIKYWQPLTKGVDDLYRAKAGLAETLLEAEQKKITPAGAIDNLERLRYAWRGDELETQIHYWLGKTYLKNGEPSKALNILREASVNTTLPPFKQRIDNETKDIFSKLFLGADLNKVSSFEAAAMYEQFADMVPPGPEGDKIGQELAERLVKDDLLDRAASLLERQLDQRVQGLEAYKVGVRLATIRLMDDKPDKALTALDKAEKKLLVLPPEQQTDAQKKEITLLRARAFAAKGDPSKALFALEKQGRSPEGNRMRADIAWNAGYWDDAAAALDDVIIDRNISLTRPLPAEEAQLILHRGIALNLANDRIGLTNLREKYADAMIQTDKKDEFEMITRPRQNGALADRATLMNMVSETDMFTDFLNTYRGGTPAPVATATTPAAPAAPPKDATPPPQPQPGSGQSSE